jgi:hypothetical protein
MDHPNDPCPFVCFVVNLSFAFSAMRANFIVGLDSYLFDHHRLERIRSVK